MEDEKMEMEMKPVYSSNLTNAADAVEANGGGGGGGAAAYTRGKPVVKVQNVHKTYLLGIEGVAALRGVTLDVGAGEFVIMLGKSGSGKTSMLNIIGTIDKPTKGDLYICGTRVTANTPDEVVAFLRLKRLGFCFQTFNLISSMTALENVELPMILYGRLSRKKIRQRAKELLESVGMGSRLSHVPSQLSGGEQQRVTIARSIANQPDILLLDEPTGDLDTKNSVMVMNLLLDLSARNNIALIMVTHDAALQSLADRVVHMHDGKLARQEYVPFDVKSAARKQLERQATSQSSSNAPAAADNPQSPKTIFRKPSHYRCTIAIKD